MECMELKICMSDKQHRYYKHTKFCQNPRGDPKFLVDLTWNDPDCTNSYMLYSNYTFSYLVTALNGAPRWINTEPGEH